MDSKSFYYAHLVSSQDPSAQVLETVKLPFKSGTVPNSIIDQILTYLRSERNDGNKIYNIASLHLGDPSLDAIEKKQVLENLGEIFVKVDISIDASKHVKPLESKSVAVSALKFTTLSKYTYFDSSDKYLKVQLSELAGLKDEKLEVEFGIRSLSVKVYGLKGQNYSFAVPKLHAKICPPDCKW
jgi:hypothetical protein